MSHYLLELYRSRLDEPLGELAARLQAGAEALTAEGTQIRYVRTIFVPGDEICFYLLEAASPEAALQLARRMGLQVERVLEAEIDTGSGSANKRSKAEEPQLGITLNPAHTRGGQPHVSDQSDPSSEGV